MVRRFFVPQLRSVTNSAYQHLCSRVLPGKYFVLGLVFTVINSNYWALLIGASNLDIGSIWLLVPASRNGVMQSGNYLTVYGPLGFLDWMIYEYRYWLIFSILWRFFAISVSYILLYRILRSKEVKIRLNEFSVIVVINLIFTLISLLLPPSFLIMTSIVIYSLFLLQERNKPKVESLVFIGFMIVFLFLVKMVYAQPLIILWVLLLLKRYSTTSGHRSYFLISLKVILSIFTLVSSLILFLLVLGFSIQSATHWLRGYMELALGYTTMMSEEPGRLWEYIAYPGISALIFLFNIKRLHVLTKLAYLLLIYQGFRYGFNRHHAHSNFSFLGLFTISLFVMFTSNKLVNKLIVLLSAFSLVVASNLSIFDTLNVTGRAQNAGQLFKVLDPRFRQTINMQSENKLLAALNLPNELRELTTRSSYTFIPWPYSVPDYMAGNYRNSPDPHLFGAWTDWLDEENYKWIQNSLRAPKYILSLGPNSVDSRNPFWDSPKFQLGLICNYGNPKLFPNNWYLFERLTSPRCDLEDTEVIAETFTSAEISLNPGYIQYLDVDLPQDFTRSISSVLFKPLFPIYAQVNEQQYRVVEKSTNFLFINGDFQASQKFWTEIQKVSVRFPEGTRIVLKKIPFSKTN